MVEARRRRAVFFSPATVVGGAETYLSLLLPSLACTWEIHLFCPATPALDRWVAAFDAHAIRVTRLHPRRRFRNHLRIVQALRAADLLYLNLTKPTISPLIGVLGLLNGVPLRIGGQHLVLTPEELSHYRLKRVALGLVARLHRCGLHWVICPSADSAQTLISRLGFPSTKVHVISNGIDLDAAGTNQDPRPRLQAQAAGSPWPVLGCVGWVQERKGQYLIVEALPALIERYPCVLALFVGNGPDVAGLRGRARDLGVEQHVSFVGHSDDVAFFYRQMDVFLLPTRAEGMPFAAIEAMAHRLPVITCDIGPMRELLADTGIFLRTRSPYAIVEAIDRCLGSENPQALGAHARMRAEEHFRLERMIAETARLIDSGAGY